MAYVGLSHLPFPIGDPPPWGWIEHLHPEDLIAIGKAQLEAASAILKVQMEIQRIQLNYVEKVTQIASHAT